MLGDFLTYRGANVFVLFQICVLQMQASHQHRLRYHENNNFAVNVYDVNFHGYDVLNCRRGRRHTNKKNYYLSAQPWYHTLSRTHL